MKPIIIITPKEKFYQDSLFGEIKKYLETKFPDFDWLIFNFPIEMNIVCDKDQVIKLIALREDELKDLKSILS